MIYKKPEPNGKSLNAEQKILIWKPWTVNAPHIPRMCFVLFSLSPNHILGSKETPFWINKTMLTSDYAWVVWCIITQFSFASNFLKKIFDKLLRTWFERWLCFPYYSLSLGICIFLDIRHHSRDPRGVFTPLMVQTETCLFAYYREFPHELGALFCLHSWFNLTR